MIDDAAFGDYLDDGTLRFERVVPGPIERVWAYLTRRELLAAWLWPVAIPPTPGAAFAFEHDAGGRFEGRVRAYRPPSLLEYEWNEESTPEGPIRDSILRFELWPEGVDVRLVLTHRALPRTARVTVGAGWHAHLDALLSHLAGRAPVDPYERYEQLAPRYRERCG